MQISHFRVSDKRVDRICKLLHRAALGSYKTVVFQRKRDVATDLLDNLALFCALALAISARDEILERLCKLG